MRSAGVAWLLDLYGFKVYTLVGGYKRFRNYILETFGLPFQFKLLGGYTGSGKTDIIKDLKTRNERAIDLEDIAKHKGSAFGSIGLPRQPTQEMFENLIGLELRSFTGYHLPVWVEDESQRIGLVNIPSDLWKNMRQSPVYFLDIPFDERLQYILREYGDLDKEKLLDAIARIREKLGGLNAKLAAQFLEEGNTIESFRILLKYYDKLYLRALHNRKVLNSLLHTIDCKSVTPENASSFILQNQFQPENL
jgi:tRNA 2-selenouridine synthase